MPEFLEERFLAEDDLIDCVWGYDWPLITSGTGSGKTKFVMSGGLGSYVEKKTGKPINFVLVLVPTEKLREDTISKYGKLGVTCLSEEDLLIPSDKPRVIVGCFQKFAKFILDGNEVAVHPDLLVFDELDQIMKWCLCFRGNVGVFDYAMKNRDKVFPTGLTATPSLLLDYANRYEDYRFCDITPNFPIKLKADDIEIVPWSSASTYLKTIKPDANNKCLVYVRGARECKNLSDRLKAQGIKAGYIISKYNQTYGADMEKQTVEASAFGDKIMNLDEYLVKEHKLPKEVDVLIINDAMTAGCNIEDKRVKTVIADTCELSIAIQAKGRIRYNIDKFVWVFNGKEKKTCFKRIEEAEPFLREGANPSQDLLKYRYDHESRTDGIDYLVCKDGDRYKLNPVARAVYEYEFDIINNKLRNSESMAEYFEPLKRHSTSYRYRITDAEKLTASIRKEEKLSSLDLLEVFNFQDGETVKLFSPGEMTAIANDLKITDSKGNKMGKNAFIEELKKRNDCCVTKKMLNRKTVYEVSLEQKALG